jgi:hypothetical protein
MPSAARCRAKLRVMARIAPLLAGDRGDVDHRAVALGGPEQRESAAGQEEGATGVGLEDHVPFVELDVVVGGVRADAAVVDEHVQRAPRGRDLGDERVDRRALAQVESGDVHLG